MKLRLFMDYGVCKDICIPARAELSLVLGGAARKRRRLIERALARVPRKRRSAAEGRCEVLGAEPRLAKSRPSAMTVRAPADAALFAEGPENWYLSTSPPQGDRFTVTVEDKPKGAHAAAPSALRRRRRGDRDGDPSRRQPAATLSLAEPNRTFETSFRR